MGILILAAQTSFADFPRVASILARDGYMPRQFAFRGERLAFNAGIVVLASVSIVLVVAFQGRVEALIPLYAIGVFTAFTLSQAGMVRHWLKERGKDWRRSAFFNGLGATVTAIVVVIFAIAKFALGAWIVFVIVPTLIALMLFVHHEYAAEARGLEVRAQTVIPPPSRPRRVVIAAPAFTRAVVQAIRVGRRWRRTSRSCMSRPILTRASSSASACGSRSQGPWSSPSNRATAHWVNPFVRYLETSQEGYPDEVVIVLIPDYLPNHWWDRVLYNQNSHRIRAALVGRRDVVVLDVPYRRERP